ncbi:MAG TPA: hypothetical protein VHQ03_11745 [Candidatus Dormibacteraeota bacterium]|nr:hypothetical protein [Candidatus Dormibacteraeota bacterium]
MNQEKEQEMRIAQFLTALTVMIGSSLTASLAQEMKYLPLSEYMMPQDAEGALAKSAAPRGISDRATIETLTASGYQVAHQGDNGFVCLVMRGFTVAPTFAPAQMRTLIVYDAKTRAPICFDPNAARTVLPYYELRTKLGLEGKSPDEIATAVQAAYAKNEIPKREDVSFAYMWSADQVLGPAGHWHPHMMLFVPYYQNSMLGDNSPASHLPFVGDDAGTPFAVAVIPVDDKLAVSAHQ